MWLFKLPLFRNTVYRVARSSAVTSFVVVLPALPVIATTFAPERRLMSRAMSCSARVVSVDRDERRGPPRPGCPRTPRRARRPPRRRAAREGRGDEPVPVEPFAADGDEQVAGGQRPGVDRNAFDRLSGVAAQEPSSGRGRHVSVASAATRSIAYDALDPARRRASAARATSTSSNGSRPVADHLVLLVPLAGDEHEIARPGPRGWPRSIAPFRSMIARQAVDLATACPLGGRRSAGMTMPRLISSMIRSRILRLAGLSEVTMTRSLSRAATAPISGRFVVIAIAAAAEHGDRRGPWPAAAPSRAGS